VLLYNFLGKTHGFRLFYAFDEVRKLPVSNVGIAVMK
jgi:hypothetical protein